VPAERYTAVFTGSLSLKKPGEYTYLIMGEDACGIGAGSTLRRGRPPAGRLRREIPFRDLPEGCRRVVLDAYRGLWGL
jgi:hypothetical protein